MTLEELNEMINQDSIINKEKLDTESLQIAALHSKYYSLMIQELREYKRLESEYSILYKDRLEYYSGLAGEAVYRANPLYRKPLKNEIDTYLKSDKLLIEFDKLKYDTKLKIEFIESFLKLLNNRGFHIKSAIDFIRFKNGLN